MGFGLRPWQALEMSGPSLGPPLNGFDEQACLVSKLLGPEQVMLAVMPFGPIETFVTWQSPRLGAGDGPPYLSIIACVTQTWLVLGAPLKGDPGGACIPGGMGDC